MSTKRLLMVVVPAVLLEAVLLAVQVMASQPEPALNTLGPLTEERLVGSDWIERHPTVVRPANYYAGSDWIERHPSPARPANYYAGSDWIERHPSPTRPAYYYEGSDWIERHPSQPSQ